MRCEAKAANAEEFAAPRRSLLGAGAALAAGSLLQVAAPQLAGAKVVSSDWELVRFCTLFSQSPSLFTCGSSLLHTVNQPKL